MYDDLRVKPTGTLVKWFKHESSKRILRISILTFHWIGRKATDQRTPSKISGYATGSHILKGSPLAMALNETGVCPKGDLIEANDANQSVGCAQFW